MDPKQAYIDLAQQEFDALLGNAAALHDPITGITQAFDCLQQILQSGGVEDATEVFNQIIQQSQKNLQVLQQIQNDINIKIENQKTAAFNIMKWVHNAHQDGDYQSLNEITIDLNQIAMHAPQNVYANDQLIMKDIYRLHDLMRDIKILMHDLTMVLNGGCEDNKVDQELNRIFQESENALLTLKQLQAEINVQIQIAKNIANNCMKYAQTAMSQPSYSPPGTGSGC